MSAPLLQDLSHKLTISISVRYFPRTHCLVRVLMSVFKMQLQTPTRLAFAEAASVQKFSELQHEFVQTVCPSGTDSPEQQQCSNTPEHKETQGKERYSSTHLALGTRRRLRPLYCRGHKPRYPLYRRLLGPQNQF